MNVWQIHLRPGGDVDHNELVAYCLEGGVVGSGWRVADVPGADRLADGCADLEQYHNAALQYRNQIQGRDPRYATKWWSGFVAASGAFARRVAAGDYCWSRDLMGNFWLGQISDEPFRYRTGGRWDELDLHMTRGCDWAPACLSPDRVPGLVRRRFTGSTRAIQQIHHDHAFVLSGMIYRHLCDGAPMEPIRGLSLFDALGPEEAEDLVTLYLQVHEGWQVVISTAKNSTPFYECVLRNRDGLRAALQVKTGNAEFFIDAPPAGFDRFYIFNANGATQPAGPDVIYVTRPQIEAFATENPWLLPEYISAYAVNQ